MDSVGGWVFVLDVTRGKRRKLYARIASLVYTKANLRLESPCLLQIRDSAGLYNTFFGGKQSGEGGKWRRGPVYFVITIPFKKQRNIIFELFVRLKRFSFCRAL